LSIDGIYGEETRLAVKAFQEIRGLDISGTVDNITNDEIYEVYKYGAKEPLENVLLESDFPISPGDIGRSVGIINHLLGELRKIYVEIPRVDKGNYYGKATEEALKVFEEIAGLETTGVVDVRLYNRMTREIKGK
jgi:peptidoglycan hydrolase-like protein with peptidoglycan-binding domain